MGRKAILHGVSGLVKLKNYPRIHKIFGSGWFLPRPVLYRKILPFPCLVQNWTPGIILTNK